MITLIIGHRGVGKTSLLERLKTYCSDSAAYFDLDREIEKSIGQSVFQIFSELGETEYRKREVAVLRRLISEIRREPKKCFIALGAGFPLNELPNEQGIEVLWLRRPTDSSKRIFLDRPRLNKLINPGDEYKTYYKGRETSYRLKSDKILMLQEGWDSPNPFEAQYFLDKLDSNLPGYSLVPGDLKNLAHLSARGYAFFELRDDLLNETERNLVKRLVPPERLLFSIRNDPVLQIPPKAKFDWSIELGPLDREELPWSVSLHDRRPGESIEAALERLERFGGDLSQNVLLKAAPIVNNFKDLLAGHCWAMKAPGLRAFLPRSNEAAGGIGRWTWYRLLTKNRYPIEFIRESQDIFSDQPYLAEWLRVPALNQSFAAVLGSPVIHSRTPAEHWQFFYNRNQPILAIEIQEEEWATAFSVLEYLGLKAAAVTSPLKLKIGGANTLCYSNAHSSWKSTNTDVSGLWVFLAKVPDLTNVVVWGGGGVLPSIKAVVPNARFYSARTGDLRAGANDLNAPETVIWAASPHRRFQMPPSSWTPKLVIDLNYTQDSPAIEYAQATGADYYSGLQMFKEQARLQKLFWSENE